MVKVMIINKEYEIVRSALKGFKGILVAYDAETSESQIKIDDFSNITISSEFLKLTSS